MKVFIHKPESEKFEVEIDTSEKLGRGATATVYRLKYLGRIWAAKIFHNEKTVDTEKILAMLVNVPSNHEIEVSGHIYPQFVWPTALLKDKNGTDIGYLMPLVDTTESYTLDYYYDQGLFKKLNRPEEAALSYRLEIAKNLSGLVAELHKHQHYFIDCKPQNIRVFREKHLVSFIDCDGFSIFGSGRRYPANLVSTDYIAPEAQRGNTLPSALAEPQDRYALAVILFQLLNGGTHPFQGIITAPDITASTNDEKAAAGLYPHGIIEDKRVKPRPQSTHHLWDEKTRFLFDLAFKSGTSSARPSAEEWAVHFKSLLEDKALVRCDKVPNNLEHIRFRGMECPACYLSGLPIFQPQKPRVQPRSQQEVPLKIVAPSQSTDSHIGWWGAGIVLILFLGFMFTSTASPKKDTQSGHSAQQSQFEQTRALANLGNAQAQNNLGVMYALGEGVNVNHVTAENLFSLSAVQGYAPAQYNLGVFYHNGIVYDQSYKAALSWYRLAAAQGYPEAQLSIGVMYENGEGVTRNRKEALKWYKLAAAQGNALAQENLRSMR